MDHQDVWRLDRLGLMALIGEANIRQEWGGSTYGSILTLGLSSNAQMVCNMTFKIRIFLRLCVIYISLTSIGHTFSAMNATR